MSLVNRLFVAAITQYQRFVSPWLGVRCIYTPTCSRYAVDAFHKYGFCKAFVLMIWRIARCNPWGAGGEDPA